MRLKEKKVGTRVRRIAAKVLLHSMWLVPLVGGCNGIVDAGKSCFNASEIRTLEGELRNFSPTIEKDDNGIRGQVEKELLLREKICADPHRATVMEKLLERDHCITPSEVQTLLDKVDKVERMKLEQGNRRRAMMWSYCVAAFAPFLLGLMYALVKPPDPTVLEKLDEYLQKRIRWEAEHKGIGNCASLSKYRTQKEHNGEEQI